MTVTADLAAALDMALVEDSQTPMPLETDLGLRLPDPEDETLPEGDFQLQIQRAWQVCDRFDLQTNIWRGRILRLVRDREKQGGNGRGSGFLNWLKDHEISKSQAYSWIELADSADQLLATHRMDAQVVERFSKRAFVETAQAPAPVQQMVTEAAQKGQRITRREVRDLTDQWTAMTSDLVPEAIREKAAQQAIPTRYMTPLVKELEKLPESHRRTLQTEMVSDPSVDTLKQVTAEARYLARYLEAAGRVRCLDQPTLDVETALEEALRLGSLNLTADLMNQAAQVEQQLSKLYTSWKRINDLADKLDGMIGASTPQLRLMLQLLESLIQPTLEVQLGSDINLRTVTFTIKEDSLPPGVTKVD
jgi:hypothetical protein